MEPATSRPDPVMLASLRRGGLVAADEQPGFEPLTGGVSSDIWKVTTARNTFCVKRALARLRVAAVWEAPLERNRFEVAWYEAVHQVLPGAVPRVLYFDEQAMLFAMDYLAPDSHALWKAQLRDGHVDMAMAAEVGRRLARIHASAAGSARVAQSFPENGIFHAIRLEPYLEATATAHPDLHDALFALSARTLHTRITLIHGDVSPKNILIGPHGPVFLDAECACIGDPAFDLAFCLNHLLLKCLWNPSVNAQFLQAFDALADAYRQEVNWESPAGLDARTATLLPGLLLARVDGKSPVEYLEHAWQREHVRRCARALLIAPPASLAQVATAWQQEIAT